MMRSLWLGALVFGCVWSAGQVQAQEAPDGSPPPDGESVEESRESVEEPDKEDSEVDRTDILNSTPPEEAAAEGSGLTAEEERALLESLNADAEALSQEGGGVEAPVGAAVSGMNLDIALVLDFAGTWFSDAEPLQVGAHDPNKTGFTLQQLEMSIGSNVDPFFRFDSNLVFSTFGVEVEEAYVTTLALPANLQARAGQFLTRFGRLNPTHPHAWNFVDQPLVNGKFFGGEGSRGLGVELSWLTPLPWYAELIGTAGDAAGECCARSFYGGDDLGTDGPEDLLYTTALKQFFDLGENWGLLWGLSAQLGPNPSGQGNRTEIYGADLYLRYRPVGNPNRSALSLQIEAMMRNRQVPDDVLRDFGGYGMLIWTLTPRWELGGRYEHVTGLTDDPLDPDWTEARARTSVQGTFYPSHFSRLRLQGSYDDPKWRSEPIWGTFLALEVLVGAHGAHAY